jgi:hypothetical protein
MVLDGVLLNDLHAENGPENHAVLVATCCAGLHVQLCGGRLEACTDCSNIVVFFCAIHLQFQQEQAVFLQPPQAAAGNINSS